jgi:sec-independent protein translocase protein TatC
MRTLKNFFRGLWKVITFPFRAIWWLIKLPFRAIGFIRRFLTEEPEDRPLTETLSTAVQQPSALFEHIEVLRKHLLRMVLALVVGIGISAFFTNQIIEFMAEPAGGIDTLQAINVTETVGTFMTVALAIGFAIALPYIAFELWLFIAPGLRARARQLGLIGIPLTIIFFAGGVAFAYTMLLPTALPFLKNFLGVQNNWTISSYINFITGILFWIGIAFEFPLVVYVISLMGLIKPQALARQWRYAVVIIAIVAAAVTPTVDPVNMSLVMLPMVLLYFISIGLSFLAQAGRRKKNEPEAG